MLKGFKEFILRGNVVDLAVGVVIGAAFGAVVNALVKDILSPLIGVVIKTPDLSRLGFTLHKIRFPYGDFLNVLISFLLVATAVYFFVVVPMNAFAKRMKKDEPEKDDTMMACPECLSQIPREARRCAHCASKVA
jgi:large conductance mechanosensitive channel